MSSHRNNQIRNSRRTRRPSNRVENPDIGESSIPVSPHEYLDDHSRDSYQHHPSLSSVARSLHNQPSRGHSESNHLYALPRSLHNQPSRGHSESDVYQEEKYDDLCRQDWTHGHYCEDKAKSYAIQIGHTQTENFFSSPPRDGMVDHSLIQYSDSDSNHSTVRHSPQNQTTSRVVRPTSPQHDSYFAYGLNSDGTPDTSPKHVSESALANHAIHSSVTRSLFNDAPAESNTKFNVWSGNLMLDPKADNTKESLQYPSSQANVSTNWRRTRRIMSHPSDIYGPSQSHSSLQSYRQRILNMYDDAKYRVDSKSDSQTQWKSTGKTVATNVSSTKVTSNQQICPSTRSNVLCNLLFANCYNIDKPLKYYIDIGSGDIVNYDRNCQDLKPRKSKCVNISDKNRPGCLNLKNYSLPFSNNSIDLVTCYMSMHHFTDPHLLFGDIQRVLMPGGYLFIREHDVVNTLSDNLIPYLDLMHMMEFIRSGIDITDNITSIYRRYWSRSELDSLLAKFGFQAVSSQQYLARYNPQRIYHTLYQFDPILVDQTFIPTLSSPEPTEFSATNRNLIQWLIQKRELSSGIDYDSTDYYSWFCRAIEKKFELNKQVMNSAIDNYPNDLDFYHYIVTIVSTNLILRPPCPLVNNDNASSYHSPTANPSLSNNILTAKTQTRQRSVSSPPGSPHLDFKSENRYIQEKSNKVDSYSQMKKKKGNLAATRSN